MLGTAALATLLGDDARAAGQPAGTGGLPDLPHFIARARRVIYLFMSGAPSQMDLYDYKPLLNQKHGQQLPDDVRQGQRLTSMSGNQSHLPLVGTPFGGDLDAERG